MKQQKNQGFIFNGKEIKSELSIVDKIRIFAGCLILSAFILAGIILLVEFVLLGKW
jgi:hypothetical protein